MKQQQAMELVTELSQGLKLMLDAEVNKLARYAKQGVGIDKDQLEDERHKAVTLNTVAILLGGVAVNIARIADAVEGINKEMGEDVALFQAELDEDDADNDDEPAPTNDGLGNLFNKGPRKDS